jgi:hypothetical protein
MSPASSAQPFLDEPWCATHPLTAHDQAVMTEVRAMTKPNKGKMRDVAARLRRSDPAHERAGRRDLAR